MLARVAMLSGYGGSLWPGQHLSDPQWRFGVGVVGGEGVSYVTGGVDGTRHPPGIGERGRRTSASKIVIKREHVM